MVYGILRIETHGHYLPFEIKGHTQDKGKCPSVIIMSDLSAKYTVYFYAVIGSFLFHRFFNLFFGLILPKKSAESRREVNEPNSFPPLENSILHFNSFLAKSYR